MIHTNNWARIENKIYLQFYHNQMEYVEKRYLSSLSLQKFGQIFPPIFTLHRLMCDVKLRNLFTSNSSRYYFSIIKFRGTERT